LKNKILDTYKRMTGIREYRVDTYHCTVSILPSRGNTYWSESASTRMAVGAAILNSERRRHGAES
jgi:hypothetical protein